MRYGSVCSGIEAATVAWHPLGWQPQFFSEIEAAPRAVLSHHYPEVPLHGDFTTIQDGQYGAIDLLVGGTPCQSFSVAGLRGGLADDRGNLALQYLRLAQRLRPRWLVWENVPGVLSSSGGRDFGAILGGMVELGYGFAYRVLDAQYVRVDGFGRAVPQRRRRVFVVGHLGDWRRAAAVLFERASLRGDLAPSRSAGARPAPTLSARTRGGGGLGTDFECDGGLIAQSTAPTLDANYGQLQGASGQDLNHGHGHLVAFGGNDTRGPINVATAVNAHGGPCGRMDFESETFIAACLNGISKYGGQVPTLRAKGGDAAVGSEALIAFDTTQITSSANRSSPQPGDPCHPLAAGAHPPAVAFSYKDLGADAVQGLSPTLRSLGGYDANGGGHMAVAQGYAVRRLVPEECEALQGFKRGYTAVPWRGGILSDGPRYKALGNSMAVNVMRWIGTRIEAVDALSAPVTLMAAE